jgi:4-alpha-glucanotransferase
MKFNRSAGILLHPTSLPGPYGMGDLGPAAYRWADWLAETGCKLWQILPLGPTGYGDSPYQCFSAFAGNPYLISPEILINEGLLNQEDLSDMPEWDAREVDFGSYYLWKPILLERVYNNYKTGGTEKIQTEVDSFRLANTFWLEDYAFFTAIKESHGGGAWDGWPEGLRLREKKALHEAREMLEEKILATIFFQYLFYKQWDSLKQYVHSKGIKIVGDIPIFVAMDSSDAWSHQDLFQLDKDGKPIAVAGVPPDYFSPTGQLWGNPLYRWEAHKRDNYAWWMERIASTFKLVDIVRIDHFRGFAGYWEILGGALTAEKGRWVAGPGSHFFEEITKKFGDLPIIAEDLGEITPDVIALRDKFSLPGMKILQFAFSGPDNPFLPHQYVTNSVVYTGTHDNDTTCGWFEKAPEHEKDFARRYFGRRWDRNEDFAWDLIRTAWGSVAAFAIVPLQDLLLLGTEARFNYPSTLGWNWAWRMLDTDLSEDLRNQVRELNWLYQR